VYVPSHFREQNTPGIIEFMHEHQFATVVSVNDRVPIASHLPVETFGDRPDALWLSGHMSRANPQWKSFDAGTEILTIFHGPHTYISPTWYRGSAVPTWNYQSVHAYGNVELISDGSELRALLTRLVERNEAGNDPADRYTLSSLSEEFLVNMMRGIVGFRVHVTRLEASSKLSQNRSDEDYQSIITELKGRTDDDSHRISAAMIARRPDMGQDA